MTRAEAAYWLRISQPLSYRESRLARHGEVVELAPDLDAETAIALARKGYLPAGGALAALVTLLGAQATLELFLTPRNKPDNERPATELFAGVRAYLMPLLDDAQRDRLRARAAEWLEEELRDPEYMIGDAVQLAAQVGGLSELVETLCARWPDEWFSDSWGAGSYATIAFGVGTAERFEELVDRVKMRFADDDEIARVARAHGAPAPGLADHRGTAQGVPRRRCARGRRAGSSLACRRGRAGLPRAADALARALDRPPLAGRAPAPDSARASSHSSPAPAGWPTPRARSSSAWRAARTARWSRSRPRRLPTTTARGSRNACLTRRCLPRRSSADHPHGSRPPTPGSRSKPLPAWVDIEALPALEAEGGSLGPAHLPAVLRVLRAGDPAIRQVRTAAAPRSSRGRCSASGCAATRPARTNGRSPRWASSAATHRDAARAADPRLAGGEPAQASGGRPRRAARDRHRRRADAAQRHRPEAQVQSAQGRRAREAMEEIARDKGMSKSELEDRIVPDCGLDEQGTRIFDYGPRQFEFVLGPGMKPMVRDAAGTVRSAPPKPGAKDDAARATAALAEWKLLRKTGRRRGQDPGRAAGAGDGHAAPLERRGLRALHRRATRCSATSSARWCSRLPRRAVEATFRRHRRGRLRRRRRRAGRRSRAQVGIVHPLELSDAAQLALGRAARRLRDRPAVPAARPAGLRRRAGRTRRNRS